MKYNLTDEHNMITLTVPDLKVTVFLYETEPSYDRVHVKILANEDQEIIVNLDEVVVWDGTPDEARQSARDWQE